MKYGSTIYRDHEGFGFLESNSSPKTQLKFYLLTVCQYWLGIADPKNVFRSILAADFKNFLFSSIFY